MLAWQMPAWQVLAWRDRVANRRPLYNGTAALRLCWPLRRCAALAAVLGALAAAGCSYRLGALTAKDDPEVVHTGAINSSGSRAVPTATAAGPSEFDLAYARAAASDALARGGKDSSVPWQNPQTGAGGNITPLAASYSAGGAPCRDFLASYVHGQSEAWLQGAACRTAGGKWEVKSLKPLKSS